MVKDFIFLLLLFVFIFMEKQNGKYKKEKTINEKDRNHKINVHCA